MCGIIGIVSIKGKTPYRPGLMVYKGLLRLEYRGYDSAGVGSVYDDGIVVIKGKGKIADLEKKLCLSCIEGYTIIGHTRWATHGAPSDTNAHPHIDCNNKIAVVHNGIIQNFRELKELLLKRGHIFRSETDTEVVPHLIEEFYKTTGNFYEAFKQAIKMLKGSYALVVITSYEPDKLFFAKKDSPLIIGLGEGYNIIASDIPALLEYTRRVITVRDNWVGYITPTRIFIEDLETGKVIEWERLIRVVEWSLEDATKAGYPHFMLKEIHEQPRALKDTFYGIQNDLAVEEAVKLLLDANKVYITGAGTSYHACYYYSILSSILAGRITYHFIASEYSTYSETTSEGDVLIVVSQSGETMDALKALKAFKEKGAKVIAISNVVDSAIPRESDVALYTRAGPEIGVAATKTFTTQTLVLSWIAITLGEAIGKLTPSEANEYRSWLEKSGEIAASVISWSESLAKELAIWLSTKNSAYYLSRGIGLPIAMEGALKLKEIAYIHAEAYPAGESKHGPIALVEEDFPVIFTVPNHRELEKLLLGNIQEMKARGAIIIGIAPETTILADQLDYWFKIPATHWILTPITHTPPQQLLAYHTAVKRGYDPDKPRNLAKTVTVE
ncbi:MAG: glutamine--fructose-6-phosphate transaminase (isomerizing) [Thermoprotei archaeon]